MVGDDKELQVDFKSARKYIRDDSSDGNNIADRGKCMFSDEKFGMGSSVSKEVLGSVGQEEGYSENRGYRGGDEDSIDIMADKHSEKIEFEDKARVKAIKEHDKNVENESITLDTINSVNRDFKRK